MKKMVYAMSLLLPAALMINSANAKSHNYTPEEKAEMAQEYEKDYTKKLNKKAEKLAEMKSDIQQDYNEAIEKINKSSFSEANKAVLRKQAEEMRDMGIKQAQDRSELCMKHMEARKNMKTEIMAEKKNRDAIKEIADIF